MIIRDIMTTNVISTKSETSIKEALRVMETNRIRHLPVVNKNNEIIGIISDRDLRDASPSSLERANNDILNRPISEVMVKDVLTALPIDFVEEAAYTMTENLISCLPIEDDGNLVGIITEKDLLDTLVKLTGADTPSSRLELEVPNKSGMLSDVSCYVKEHNINIQSVLVYPSSDSRKKILVFRLQTMHLRPLLTTLKNKGFSILWPMDLELKS